MTQTDGAAAPNCESLGILDLLERLPKATVPVYCLNLGLCAPGTEGHLKRLTLSPPLHSPLLRGTETRKKHLWAGSPGKHRNLTCWEGRDWRGLSPPLPLLKAEGVFHPKGNTTCPRSHRVPVSEAVSSCWLSLEFTFEENLWMLAECLARGLQFPPWCLLTC